MPGGEAGLSGRVPIDRAARGRVGEDAAAVYLTGKGYTVLGANQRTPAGEVDLVCRHGGQIVIVEVKARGSCEFGTAIEAIGPRKARRMRAAALWWLADRGLLPCQTRFDAVLVMLDAQGLPRTLEHVQDIIGKGY
jgi:putative endonuclease